MKRKLMLLFFCFGLVMTGWMYAQDALLSAPARAALAELVNGNYTAFYARFDDKMKAAIPEPKLPEIWKSITSQFGPFKSAGTVRQDKSGEYDVVVVTCQFEKGLLDVRLVFNPQRQIAGLFFAPAASQNVNRLQNPKKPYPYREEEVGYSSREPGIKLAGTLTLPSAGGPFPAVLLITGSGAQNRDEEIMGHRPFLVLADHLTRKGIAVLRVDDRGVGGSTMGPANVTSRNFAQDVLGGLDYLKTRKEIDPRRIGLIGHSEGGIIAPMVAAQSPDVAFIVLMAGTGIPGEDVLYEQAKLGLRMNGASEELVEENFRAQKLMFDILKSTPDNESAQKKISQALAGFKPEIRNAVASGQAQAAASDWMRYFLTYDPRPALQKVSCPVLAINGEKDFQVSARQNLPAIEKALRAGGNKDFKVVELPGLNHMFQTCKTGSLSEYAQIEETISPVALDLISGWILEHAMQAPK